MAKFPGSKLTKDLTPTFQASVEKFIDAITAAGGSVRVNATYRPRERAYLMHYATKIAKGKIKAEKVPPMTGVNIDWVHETDEASVAAAEKMRSEYDIVYPPELVSRHTERGAIDMTISNIIGKKMTDAEGKEVKIEKESDLHAVGKSYGVIKLLGDKPHWSDDGH